MDWERIETLLNIVDLVGGHPHLKSIHDRAMAELREIANPPVEEEPVVEATIEEEEKPNVGYAGRR